MGALPRAQRYLRSSHRRTGRFARSGPWDRLATKWRCGKSSPLRRTSGRYSVPLTETGPKATQAGKCRQAISQQVIYPILPGEEPWPRACRLLAFRRLRPVRAS